MYLSRAKIKPDGWRKVGRLHGNGPYAMHRLVWDLFPKNPDADRDFLFNYDGKSTLMVLSKRAPMDDPEYFEVQTKLFEPSFQTGQFVRFRTTVNPVVRIEVDGTRKKAGIVQNARVEAMERGEEPKPRDVLAHQKGLQWLQKREQPCGFEVEKDTFQVLAYEKVCFRKGRNKHRIQMATMTAIGVLCITDPDLFKKAICDGIGSSKAFGCGLLLVRPL